MRKQHIIIVMMLTLGLLLSLPAFASAESKTVNGHCYFNGDDIVSDFDSNTVADSIRGLEPGDDVKFKVEFKNKYKTTTNWYMRNEVLKTLEESFDRTENGGYTYKLVHIRPDGTRQVLFDNSEVGGEAKVANMEGLHQATNATEEWFFIQKLKQGQKAYTELYVKFDGESEVNDYMDTYGKLEVAYAVELDKAGTSKKSTNNSNSRTGDTTNLLWPMLLMTAALLTAILTLLSRRKDRKEGDEA